MTELNLVAGVVLSLSIFLGLAGHLLFLHSPVEAGLSFTYHLFIVGLAALGTSFVALVIEVARRVRDRYYEGKMHLCALTGLFAILALIGVLGCREYDHFRTWGWLSECGRCEFSGVSYFEYSWCVGDREQLDLSGASKIWFASQTTRDSGGYNLWRVRLNPGAYAAFLRNNAVLKGYSLPTYAAHQIPWHEMPRRWAAAPEFDWWRPPASLEGCECYQWSDQSGTAIAWSVYDPRNDTLWFRQ